MGKTRIPVAMRQRVLQRDGYKCRWCGRGVEDGIKLEADHVYPDSLDGPTSDEYLGTLCKPCNIGKSNKYVGDYLLTTVMKIPNIWNQIQERSLGKQGPDGKYYNGMWTRLSLNFYEHDGQTYREREVRHDFIIPEILLISKGADTEIRINEIKKKAEMDLKEKIRQYIIDRCGFLEQVNDMLVLKNRIKKSES